MRQGLLSLEGKAFNHQSLYGFAVAQTSTDRQKQESHERSLKMETEAVSKWPSHSRVASQNLQGGHKVPEASH